MIYVVGQGSKQELHFLEQEIRNRTALTTDEQVNFVGLYTSDDVEKFLKNEQQADIICVDITVLQGIAQAEMLRAKYPKAAIILLADMSISPISYMKPTILAAGLLLKPLNQTMVQQVVKEIFQCFLQENVEEEVLIVETRDEKQRIPYSQILYFEARSKKIYVCTKDYEYGFYDTMDHLEELYTEKFVRCHRSFMVNRKMVEQVKLSQNYVMLNGGIEIPLSRSYKSQMKELY